MWNDFLKIWLVVEVEEEEEEEEERKRERERERENGTKLMRERGKEMKDRNLQ